jgi:nucleoside-diphosphate-sugar epimerase
MSTLLCFGLGYSAEHYVANYGDGFAHIVGQSATPELHHAIGDSDAALISIPQDESGDPVLRTCGDDFAHTRRLQSIVYLSTIGVYGDRGGDWVDEETDAKPDSNRSRGRRDAERAWQELGRRRGIPVAILRLAGIYGPERNALTQVARGDARRIVKPGQVFNRIHVDDIAQAIDAAFARKASGIFNVTDDEPSSPSDPLTLAAQLLGAPPPPEILYEQAEAAMSPLAKSFWQECRRVKNDKLKRELGVTLRYPTYREGLQELYQQQKRGR